MKKAKISAKKSLVICERMDHYSLDNVRDFLDNFLEFKYKFEVDEVWSRPDEWGWNYRDSQKYTSNTQKSDPRPIEADKIMGLR